MSVAEIILEQLGGNKFRAMTGAKNFTTGGQDVTFKLPGAGFAKNGINCVTVKLTPMDDYTVTFYRIRGVNVKEVSCHVGIYCDQLRGLFERETGLRTSLEAVYA